METEHDNLIASFARVKQATGHDCTDAGEALAALAKQRVANSGDKISFERALELTMAAEPALAEAYAGLD